MKSRWSSIYTHGSPTGLLYSTNTIMHAPEVVIQLQNDLGRYLARTTLVVVSLVPPYVTMCKVYCEATLLWKNMSWPTPAYCVNEQLGYKNDHVSWSHLLVGQLFGKKKTPKMVKKKKKKKKNSLYSLRDFGSFRDAVFIPRASNEELSKIHLVFEREWQRREVSVSIRLERQVISGLRPTDQRRSAGTTFSGSDDWFLQLTRSYSATCTRSSQFQRWDAAKRRFSFRFQKALPVYWESALAWRLGERHKWMFFSDLRLHVVKLRVSVYSRVHLKFSKYGNVSAFSRIFRDMCCTCIMSDNVLAVGLFWRNDLGCASVVPSEQTSRSYIILDVMISDKSTLVLHACFNHLHVFSKK